MKKPFHALTRKDVERLRRMPVSVPAGHQGVSYGFSAQDIANAVAHLETLYEGTVYRSFAAKILLLNEIY